jgi:4-amino-4-deoxy-L-arabinose transferase-like glycosyltransferase
MTSANAAAHARFFPWLLFAGILLNVPGLWLDIIEPDGALYATIAKHMIVHRDWINLFGDGHDWLDKPHFPFWMAALSYKIFGINSFAYKLPAFLFWLLGLRYTYLLGRDLYNAEVARIATLLYAVTYHSVIANFDVRAEPYLTTCTIGAIWHMLVVYRSMHWSHLLAAALFSACAVMTKGIFVLLTICGGWVIYWMLTRQFQEFVKPRWWIMLLLCFIFILPELYSLYVQFDLHPEKTVFGENNVSGLRFFFWDSQFGRFFNTGPIKGSGDITFFLHTMLWAFLPWSIPLVTGVVYLIRSDNDKNPLRWIMYGSALLTFLLFSLSKFQLPHYVIILFPHFSLIAAYFLHQQSLRGKLRPFVVIQTLLMVLVAVMIPILLNVTNLPNAVIANVITAGVAIGSFWLPSPTQLYRLLLRGYALAAILYIFLFFFFYPFLLRFQSGRAAAAVIPESDKNVPMAAFGSFSYSFEFYAPGDVQLLNDQQELDHFLAKNPCYLYTDSATGAQLLKSNTGMKLLATPAYFRITMLKPGFLDHKTREQFLETRYLLYKP